MLMIALMIIAVVLIFKYPEFKFLGATTGNILREPLLLERNFGITSDIGSIQLPEGTQLENIRKIELKFTACSTSFTATVQGLEQPTGAIGTASCESQYYADPNDPGGKEYVHYVPRSIIYNTDKGIASDAVNYEIKETSLATEYKRVLEKKMIVYELIECDRSSQCVAAAPYCNPITHKCAVSVEKCTTEYETICGENGITYINGCYAAITGASVSYQGKCTGEEPEESVGYEDYLKWLESKETVTAPSEAGMSQEDKRILLAIMLIFVIFILYYVAKK